MSNRDPYEKTTRVEDNEVTMSTTQIMSSTKLGATGPEVFPRPRKSLSRGTHGAA
jgi:hypothetical protein